MNARRRCAVPDPVAFIAGLNPFQALHVTDQTGLQHPAFLTPEEKRERARRRHLRRKNRAAKAEEAKRKALDLNP